MGKLIALDNGHGSGTPGKRTPLLPNGIKSEVGLPYMNEYYFNRAVVKYLDQELKRNGFSTLNVSPTAFDTPLSTRTSLANSKKADLYISVHANASTDKWSDVTGIETFTGSSSNSKKLAKLVHRHLMNGNPIKKDRGVKDGTHLHVLKRTNMPAVLLECGFMNSKIDYTYLLQDSYRRFCAVQTAKAICEYFGVKYNGTESAATTPVIPKPVPKTEPKPEEKKEEEKVSKFNPSKDVLTNSCATVLGRFERKSENGLDAQWREKLLKGELTDSDMIGLLFVAVERGHIGNADLVAELVKTIGELGNRIKALESK